MAISTFAELKTAVDAWADQGGALDAYLEDFIGLATDMFNHGSDMVQPLRVREMVAVSSLTPASGVCTLPTDYLQYRRVVEKASIRRELTYIAPMVAEQDYADRAGGLSDDFTIVGSSLYMFPVSTNDIELTYFQKIPDLSVSATTNWLLTKHPMIYLHGALMQLALFRRDEELASRSAQIISSLTNGLHNSDTLANYAYAPTRLRMTIA